MKTYSTLHEVTDWVKFAALVESFRLGRPVTPVVVQGVTALTGSHRIAAYEAAWRAWSRGERGWENAPEPILYVIEVSDEDYLAACHLLDVSSHDEIMDFDLFTAALYTVTEDGDLKEALADQRGDYENWTKIDFDRYMMSH